MSGGFGAGTDPITNLTTFPRVSLRTELPELFRIGPAPGEHLQSFLHETTHHWCFDSWVGSAWSTVGLRARIDAARFADEPDLTGLVGLSGSLTRWHTAQALLGPFIEGLALFAEFDAVPHPKSRVRSAPLDQVAHFFGQPLAGGTNTDTVVVMVDDAKASADIGALQFEIDKWLLSVLGKSRLSETCLQRKMNILVHPYDVSNGYLPGYLFVKGIWQQMARGLAPRLIDERDLLLTYLRHFVFQDPRIVTALLDRRDEDPTVTASRIARAIDQRFESILNLKPQMVVTFEEIIDSDEFSYDHPDYLASIQVESEDQERATVAMGEEDSYLRSLADPKDTDSFDFALGLGWEAAMATRQFVHLGAFPLRFAVKDGGVECPHDEDVADLANGASTIWRRDTPLTAGSAELLLASEGGLPRRLLTFATEEHVVGIAALPFAEPTELDRWLHQLGRRSDAGPGLIKAGGEILAQLREILVDHTSFGDAERYLQERVHDAYTPWALFSVDPANRANIAGLMRQNGLYGLLGTLDDVRALAGLSLSTMMHPLVPFIEHDLESWGIDPQAWKRFLQFNERHDFPYIRASDDMLLLAL